MLINFKNECKYCVLALGVFTRLPLADSAQHDDLNNHAAKHLPLVGIAVGSVGALGFYLASFLFPVALAVLISMACTIYLTKAQLENGLVKSIGGVSNGSGKEQAFTSVQNSQLNGYAMAVLWVVLFAKFQALSAMHPAFIPLILIAGHALSRFAVVLTMATLRKVKEFDNTHISIQKTDLVISLFFAVLPFLVILYLLNAGNQTSLTIVNFVLMSILPMMTVWYCWQIKLLKRFAGYTDDSLGAMQQLTELAFYLGTLAWSLNLPG